MGIKYTHTNINSPDAQKLAAFYMKVFGCTVVPPERDLHGEWFDKVTGMKGARARGMHLLLPGYGAEGPTIEIFTQDLKPDNASCSINGNGFAHMAFAVDDVRRTYELIVQEGGSACGEIVSHYYESKDSTLTFVYAKDPDGNIIEVQRWD